MHAVEYYSALKKEGNSGICYNMDGPGRQYAQWNEPVTGRQILYDSTYMMYLELSLSQRQKVEW